MNSKNPTEFEAAGGSLVDPAANLRPWSVSLVFDNPDGEMPVISNVAQGKLINALAGSNVNVAYGEDFLAISMTIQAMDHRTAASIGASSCDDGFIEAELPALMVADCRAIRADRQEALDNQKPDFIGVSEIAEILSVSKQRAWQKTKGQGFPAAACHPKAGPLWRKKDILGLMRNKP
jgi:hypothetical protein